MARMIVAATDQLGRRAESTSPHALGELQRAAEVGATWLQ